ncbi:hypothetical protein CVT25_004128 [Psilocybe cyanescens]|uniref:AB hydrolase-1 domain-containing protein n=1 Tax=Psilocybe cyanescens TaxID=93625 RepID=A0A409XKV7_PSICY|nr:hypothetical protein CVT25_004128 [Psilocybe cyanescens]
MIKNSLFDFIIIRISITALRLIAPVSILYAPCGFLNLLGLPRTYNVLLTLYTTAEAAFYLFVYLPRRRKLQAPPVHTPPSLTRAERQRIFDKCIEADTLHSSLSSPSARTHIKPYPTGWFLPANSTPTRKDAIDWLLWALFSTSREAGTVDLEEESVRVEMNEYIERIEKAIGRKLETSCDAEVEELFDEVEGHVDRRSSMDEEAGRQRESRSRDSKVDGKGVRSMRVTLDPVQMLHRPLLWYFIVCLVDTYTSIFLLSLGFKHYTPCTREHRVCFPPRPILYFMSKSAPPGVVVPYWYRPHRSRTKMPVVFLHGIGIGLYPYIPFIRKLFPPPHPVSNEGVVDQGDVGVLLPELLPISMHMTPLSVPPRAEMLRSLDIILDHLKTSGLDVEHWKDGEEGRHERYHDHDEDQNERSPLLRASSSISLSSSSSSMGASLPSYATITPPHSQRRLSVDTTSNPNLNLNLNSNRHNGVVPGANTGWDSVVLVAHSYGTFVAGWIMRMCVDVDLIGGDGLGGAADVPDAEPTTETKTTGPAGEAPHTLELAHKIAHMVLVDPIPILLSDPTVAHNFLYREPGSVSPVLLGSVGGVGGVRHGEGSNGGVGMGIAGSVGVGGESSGPDIHGRTGYQDADGRHTTNYTFNSNSNSAANNQAISGIGAPNHSSWSRYYSSAAAWQLWYFASRDADVARTLCRAFFWAEGGVWREEVEGFIGGAGLCAEVDSAAGAISGTGSGSDSGPRSRSPSCSVTRPPTGRPERGRGQVRRRGRNTAVFLGGMDQIVPAEAIRRHLTKEERWTTRWALRGSGFDGDSDDYTPAIPTASVSGTAAAAGEVEREEEEEVIRVLNDPSNSPSFRGDGSASVKAKAISSLSPCQDGEEGMLEVLFNPILDHAVIFDEERYTEPLVEVVRRYIGER